MSYGALETLTRVQFATPRRLAVVGDSLVITDGDAVLLLRHGAR